MGLEIIPAIDVSGGRLARLVGGEAQPIEAFDGDPLAAAGVFVDAGARWLHVVDLDLAVTGEPGDLHLLREIAALGVAVQAGGGIVSESSVEAALRAGASRVVLGSAALANRSLVERSVVERGDALALGIEADGPRIRPRGRRAPELPLWETLQWLAGVDVRRFVYTELGRSGEMVGPDLDGIWALASHTGRPVVASGGVRSIDDLRAMAALDGVEGAIVGRALHEGLDLHAAIAALA